MALGMAALIPCAAHATDLQDMTGPRLEPVTRSASTAAPRTSLAATGARVRDAADPAGEMARLEEALARGDADATRLCRAAHLALALGLLAGDAGDEDGRVEWLRQGEAYARRAAELRPESPEPRYLIGAALGLRTAHEPVRARIRMAAEIRQHAESVLLEDPAHAGGLHLLGQLNAAVMRVSGFSRFLARAFAGDALADASWAKAEAAFRGALNAEPDNHAHRIELALVLRDTGRPAEARAELLAIIEAPRSGPLDEHYLRRAIDALGTLK